MGITKDIIKSQLNEGLIDVSGINIPNILFVYEPVWSVGSDVVPTSDEILEARILIKKIISMRNKG